MVGEGRRVERRRGEGRERGPPPERSPSSKFATTPLGVYVRGKHVSFKNF